jgi:FixJ family two-component response regulator
MEATHEATQSFQCPFCEFSDTREWLVRSHINLSDAGSHLNRGGFFKEDELERRGPDGEVTETVAGDPRSRYETLHSLGTENMPSGLSTTERVILQTTVQNLSKSYSEIETLVNDRLRETTREMVDYNKVYRTIIETLGVARKSSNMSSSKQTATYDELTRKQRAVINEYIRDAEQSMATIASNLGVESSYAEEVIEQYGDLADRMTNVDVVPVDSSNGFDENTTMTDQAAEEQYNGLTQLERTVVDELVENPRKQNQRIATDVGCDTAFPDKIETKYSELIHHRRTTAENGPITVEAGEVNYVIQPDLKEALDELTQREQTVVFELIQEPNPLDPISPETIGRTVGADEEFVAETIDAHKGTIIRVNNEALPAQHLSRETTTPTTEPAETQTTEPEPFDQRFRAALEDGDVTAVTAAEITEHIDEIESPDAIRRGRTGRPQDNRSAV